MITGGGLPLLPREGSMGNQNKDALIIELNLLGANAKSLALQLESGKAWPEELNTSFSALNQQMRRVKELRRDTVR